MVGFETRRLDATPDKQANFMKHTLKANGPKPAPRLGKRRTGTVSILRLMEGAGTVQHKRVSDTRSTQWDPITPGERLAVWHLSERWTRCGDPRCRCSTNPNARHGPYLSLRLKTPEGTRHQVYIPVGQAADVGRAVRQAKGVRTRRLTRQRTKARRDREDFRWGVATLNAAYGRPRPR